MKQSIKDEIKIKCNIGTDFCNSIIEKACNVIDLTEKDIFEVLTFSKSRTRLFYLYILFRNLEYNSLKLKNHEIHEPILRLNGESIFQMLLKQNINEKRILFAASGLNMIRQSYKISDPFKEI